MKKIFFAMGCLVLSGCAVTINNETVPKSFSGQKPLTQIDQIHLGMTYQDVSSKMGEEVIVGYREKQSLPGTFDPITVKNPYRTEVVTQGDKTYDVLYYFTHIEKPDGIVADDELTPLIFEYGKLAGKGTDALFKIKNKLNP